MDEYLAWSREDRRLASDEAAARIGLAATSIEKDWWVSLTLRELFSLDIWGDQLTFKGGTSLSKGWKLIDRFSEDIDVVIARAFLGFSVEAPSNRELERLRQTCSTRISDELRPALEATLRQILPDEEWSLELAGRDLDPEQETLIFRYPPAYDLRPGYVLPAVKIELGARSDTDPAETPLMQPILCAALPELFVDPSFSVRTVAPKRTFWEKAMLLHEALHRPGTGLRRPRLARHLYDVSCLILRGVAAEAAADEALFQAVVSHRQRFFRYSWMNYSTMRRGSLRIVPAADHEHEWRLDYEAMGSEMFYADPPPYDAITRTLREFEATLNAGF